MKKFLNYNHLMVSISNKNLDVILIHVEIAKIIEVKPEYLIMIKFVKN